MRDLSPSLRRRLFARLLFPLFTLLALAGSASFFIGRHYANEVYDGCVIDSLSSLASLTLEQSDGLTSLNPHGFAPAPFESNVADKTYFKATSNRRGYIAGYAGLPPTPPDTKPYRGVQLFTTEIDGAPARVAALDVPGSEPDERVVLQVAETQRKRRDLADTILLSALAPQLLVVVVAGLAIWFGVRNGLKPLDAVAAAIGAQSHRSLQPIPESGVPTEVRPLTNALNALLSRLDATLAAQRKFVADAAHQLRTPLAALKLHLDQVQNDWSAADMRATLDRLRVSTDRAVRLAQQLLALAQAEPEAAQQQPMERLDLRRLAQETGADWVPRALKKNIDLEFVADPQPVEVIGNEMLLREAINNLLDNAVKYHPGDGRITLSVAGGDQACLSVEDDGPGIPADQRTSAVQRFHRGDRKITGGAGLGLAIVQEITGLHQGTLRLLEAPSGRGLRAEMRLRAGTRPVT